VLGYLRVNLAVDGVDQGVFLLPPQMLITLMADAKRRGIIVTPTFSRSADRATLQRRLRRMEDLAGLVRAEQKAVTQTGTLSIQGILGTNPTEYI
jgi:hypothetical protein